ncbi:hypothetical protein AN641_08745 [Candidatus Epulonipiscioides gigas]|nr:hypothetical protein AN641_08745 [Epulopiscium sp. SCG-C07WGA-EpuloA2]
MRKKINLLIIIATLLLSFTGYAYAEQLPNENEYDPLYNKFAKIVKPELLNGARAINLQDLGINRNELEEFYFKLLENDPLLFHVAHNWEFTFNTDGIIFELKPKYDTYLKNNYNYFGSLITNEIEKVLALTEKGATNLDKMLILNDYLATNYKYDSSLRISDVARFVEKKKGVCQSYTNFAKFILDELNIPNIIVSSKNIIHTWNMVKYQDKWYNIDFTWSDPLTNGKDILGSAHHDNFMTSNTKKIKLNKAPDDWTKTIPHVANDVQYENIFSQTKTPFVFMGDKVYYMTNGNIYSIDTSTGKSTLVYDALKDITWPASQKNYYYSEQFTGFAGKDNYLYYNTPYSIMAYDINAHTTNKILEISQSQSTGYKIWGFNLSDNQLTYAIGKDIAYALSHKIIDIKN